jgi:Fur family transcriptional regulator, ferric uptake regulator
MGSAPRRREIGLSGAVDLLRQHQQRVTPARIAVLKVLNETADHLGAAEIVSQAEIRAPGVHRATVYRALSTLCELGIVTHTHVAGSGSVYHITPTVDGTHHAHSHLQCTSCGALFDLPAEFLLPLVRTVERDLGFRLEPQHAALVGICSDCR